MIMFPADLSEDALPPPALPACLSWAVLWQPEWRLETLPRAQSSIRWTLSILHIPASLDDKGQACGRAQSVLIFSPYGRFTVDILTCLLKAESCGIPIVFLWGFALRIRIDLMYVYSVFSGHTMPLTGTFSCTHFWPIQLFWSTSYLCI